MTIKPCVFERHDYSFHLFIFGGFKLWNSSRYINYFHDYVAVSFPNSQNLVSPHFFVKSSIDISDRIFLNDYRTTIHYADLKALCKIYQWFSLKTSSQKAFNFCAEECVHPCSSQQSINEEDQAMLWTFPKGMLTISSGRGAMSGRSSWFVEVTYVKKSTFPRLLAYICIRSSVLEFWKC